MNKMPLHNKKTLELFLVVPGMAFDGDTINKQSLGGSESAGYYMGCELARRGHRVTIFANLPEEGMEKDGVTYVSIAHAQTICERAPHDVLIVQRMPRFFGGILASKQCYLWNHGLALKCFYVEHQGSLWNCDGIFLLSKFHMEQTLGVYNFLAEDFCIQSRNGIDLDSFPGKMQKIPGKVMYSARPERGLSNLVGPGGIMELLQQADPNIHLYVAGYDNTVPQMRALYEELWRRCDELPNVTRLGALPKAELYRHLAESEAYVYPSEFEEISCITAMEAMACGTPFITSPVAALTETLNKKTAVWIPGKASTPKYHQDFAMAVIDLLSDRDKRRKMSWSCRERAKQFGWAGVAEQWETLFYERFAKATQDKKKLAQHFLYHDDVVVAKHIAEKYDLPEELEAIEEKCDWAWSKDTHDTHYDQFSAEEVTNWSKEQLGLHYDQVFQKEIRWAAMQEWFALNRYPKDTKILDVGCGCGYFSVGLANLGYNITGIDVSQTYLDQAEYLAGQRLQRGKVVFMPIIDGDKPLADCLCLKSNYDVIIISEVLEHLGYIDPVDFVKQYEPYLKPGGRFLITTPHGPLKRTAAKNSGQHHDLHIRHLELADIYEMFAKKEAFANEVLYWQHTQYTKELVGWHMYSFGKSGEYGKIDLDRKLLVQTPRDRLSVCMIVKNERLNLQKCLDSVYEIADEIIIADTGSTDNSVDIGLFYGAKIVPGANPLQVGFEVPRNQSIEQASGDWILWIDADETIQAPENLIKYLRNSPYAGYRIRQHHFACQPMDAYKIDRPTRLFRNNKGIRFFGLIHEHPETRVNEGVGEVTELSDVDIAHQGYYTEPERRKKFWRNLPLQLKDREKYPERILGKFLFMRDLIQLVQWSIEQTGRLTPDAYLKCQDVIQMYRNTFLSMGGYMMVDGLQYYQTALILINKGQDYSWLIDVNQNGNVNIPTKGRFSSKEDFQVFLSKVIDDKSILLEGDYLK